MLRWIRPKTADRVRHIPQPPSIPHRGWCPATPHLAPVGRRANGWALSSGKTTHRPPGRPTPAPDRTPRHAGASRPVPAADARRHSPEAASRCAPLALASVPGPVVPAPRHTPRSVAQRAGGVAEFVERRYRHRPRGEGVGIAPGRRGCGRSGLAGPPPAFVQTRRPPCPPGRASLQTPKAHRVAPPG